VEQFDSRFVIRYLDSEPHEAGREKRAADLFSGDYVAVLKPGDWLSPSALSEVVRALSVQPGADVLYSDEEITDGQLAVPYFKPAWSPDTLRSHNYIGGLCVMHRELFQAIGGVSSTLAAARDYDLILRATERATAIVHIPEILYHRRKKLRSPADELAAHSAGKQALEGHLRRLGLRADILDGAASSTYHVIYPVPNSPKLSIIVPNRDHQPMLQTCVESLELGGWPNYELIIVENGSRDPATFDYYRTLDKQSNVRVLRLSGEFNFSRVNNEAAALSSGELLLLLNNDVQGTVSNWVRRLVEHAVRRDIGAVGAKLYYPDGRIQHAGDIIGITGIAGHAHQFEPGEGPGYFGRLITTQNLSAVTAACLMLRREVFERVGGLDEIFCVAFGDVDLCLRIMRQGWRIVWTPLSECRHYESCTRGVDDTPEKKARFRQETQLFYDRWKSFLRRGDPYYNPNLTIWHNDFSVRSMAQTGWNFETYPPAMKAGLDPAEFSPRAA
jgi:GT2 family glycosyltransferase